MFRRLIFGLVAAAVVLLAVAAPVFAGGWAVVTLDSLPRELRAGQSFELGFVVRQHGQTPTNQDLNGKPLKPVLTARKQAPAAHGGALALAGPAVAQATAEDTIRAEARQDGAAGHYVASVMLPSEGVWEWQIDVPTYYIQNNVNGQDGSAAIFAPLTVLPAVAAPAARTFLGISPLALRWGGVALLLVALALFALRGLAGRRRAILS